MFFRRSRIGVLSTWLACVALLAAGCRHKPAAPAGSCSSSQRGANRIVEVSARASVGKNEFTVDESAMLRTVVAPRSAIGEQHFVVRRNGSVAIEADTVLLPKGAIEVHVRLGVGFDGPKDARFISKDRETVEGTLDGNAITPFKLAARPSALTFADGRPVPMGKIDEDVRKALPLLARSVEQECPKKPLPPMPLPELPSKPGDPPGHYTNPHGSSACDGCEATATAALAACAVVAAAVSIECLVFYAVCLAAALLTCATAWYITVISACDDVTLGGSPGNGPCCPVGCGGNNCCGNGETCVGTNGLCCAPTLKPCGTGFCCPQDDTCLMGGIPTVDNPSGASCCPSGNQVCSGACCPNADQICNPNTQTCCKRGAICGNSCCDGTGQVCVNASASLCCAQTHACGQGCCANNESCTDPNHVTCSPCANCAGPGKECCFGQCCSGAQIFCDVASRSCKCKPDCTFKCGGASDGCGGTCNNSCPEFTTCFQGKCCSPNCVGKCGGVPDSCGGTCKTCDTDQVCRGQTCCTKKCASDKCGASDGCGGTCAGLCPQGAVCNLKHLCVATTACGVGRVDCCGDGSCCRTAGQCYKCGCGGL
jgi:hypothetical protein